MTRVQDIIEQVLHDLRSDLFDRPIMNNLARPMFVERLIARLLGEEWRQRGMNGPAGISRTRVRTPEIEIKQSAARQSWSGSSGKATRPIFDIKERTGFYRGTVWHHAPGRHADLYIFAWHDGYEPENRVDHRDPSQWIFYVLPERLLPTEQKQIALSRLVQLGAQSVQFEDLAPAAGSVLQTLRPYKAERELSSDGKAGQ